MNTNVIPLPQLSEIDKQFIALERQQKEIREQAKLIQEKLNNGI
jgi:hypothetical protein|tara:strand:+ start:617 stop:748 length:132 start_codon:yes stop_codon:yes gene_type:complete